MIGWARTYAHTIMGCTRSGLDRALTSIGYGNHVRFLDSCMAQKRWSFLKQQFRSWKKSTVQELEKIQHLVSSFILQLPESSSQVMGWMEAGLQPIQQRLDTRTVLFAHDLMTRKKDYFSYWYGSDIPVGGLGCPRWGFLQISSHISHILEWFKGAPGPYPCSTVDSL